MDPQKLETLTQEVRAFQTLYLTRHSRNYHSDWVIALFSLLITAAIAIVGIIRGAEAPKIMAIMSVVNAALIGSHRLAAC